MYTPHFFTGRKDIYSPYKEAIIFDEGDIGNIYK